MDVTSLGFALLVALGLLSYDTIRHADVVELQVITAPSFTASDRSTLDQTTLEREFGSEIRHIADTPSLVPTPLIQTTQDEGIGMAVFAAINLKRVADALQAQFGYSTDHVRLTLYVETGELRGLIHGADRRVGSFGTSLTAGKDESLLQFVHRCSDWTAGQLAPYTTALYALQLHVDDGDFTEATDLIKQATAEMPPAPASVDRSLFDNLLGLIALFRNDTVAARLSFEAAVAADAANPAALLNAAFIEVQLGDYAKAEDRMRKLTADRSAEPAILAATAYMTRAAAEMGQHHFSAAEALLARSTVLNPNCAAAFELWSELERAIGDENAAAARHQDALNATGRFQNFLELAVLHFKLSWQPDQPVARSKFDNPAKMTFH